MFDFTSRYYKLPVATHQTLDGQQISYKKRRFLPQGEKLPLLQELTLTEDERLDRVTARTLGNPEFFWRIADANNAMNPSELAKEIDRVLKIPMPQAE